jgi:O-antigen ligase
MGIESKDIQLRAVRQPVLVVALALLGVGNLVIPATGNTIIANYLLFVIVAIAVIVAYRIPRILRNFRFVPLILVLAGSYVPGFLVSPLNDYGMIKLFGVGIAIVLLIAPTVFVDPSRSIVLLLVLLGVIAFAMCLALLLVGVQGNVGRTHIQGLNPIATARVTALLPVVALSAVAYYWSSIARWRVALFGVAVLGAFATVVTGSRGPIVSALVALIFLLPVLYRAGKMNGRLFWALAAFGAAMVLVFGRFSIPGLDRVLSADTAGRDLLYSESLRILAENPRGIGWGNLADQIQFPSQAIEGRLYSHNVFLEIGVEGGWIALLATLAVVAVALRVAYKHAINGNAGTPLVYAALVFNLANAQFSSDIVGNRLLWLFLGLALGIGAILKDAGPSTVETDAKGMPVRG